MCGLIEIFDLRERGTEAFLERIRNKSYKNAQQAYDSAASAQKTVDEIVEAVKTRGDEALIFYAEKLDNARLTAGRMVIEPDEIAEIASRLDPAQYAVIERAARRIRRFHELQRRKSWFETGEDGEILGQLVTPVERVGAYVPGGTAVLPSSLLMSVIPARVAGVKSVAVCTPPHAGGEISPALCAAAKIAGADRIYTVGGAAAVAALAYGTETVRRVDKIVGPGNIYVALAKKAVFGQVGIDSIAGPSEITVIADGAADPAYVAADLLSQAEHVMSSAICLTDSAELAAAVKTELERQIGQLSTRGAAEASLRGNGAIAVVKDIKSAIDLANAIAPEHLELCVGSAFSYLPLVKNAGAVFLGKYSPEPMGDYIAGPNHILPTGGTARFFSPLSVDDFVKKTSIISLSKKVFEQLAGDVMEFAGMEKLAAHAASVRVRLEGER